MTTYIQTTDPKQNIRIDRSSVSLVPALHPTQFNLTNTLKREALVEARAVAAGAGLRLSNVKRVAVTH